MDTTTFAERLRDLRIRAELTITDLADRTGFSRPYLSRLENGRAEPSLPTAIRLARALSLPLGVFDLDPAACEKNSP